MTKIKQTKRLRKFYKSYYKWIKKGAPEGRPYSRSSGLCHSCQDVFESYYAKDEMNTQFNDAGLNSFYPFGEQKYDRAGAKSKMHKDKNRIRWVKAHLGKKVKVKFKRK